MDSQLEIIVKKDLASMGGLRVLGVAQAWS